jgi:hypothetical protein
MTGRRERSSTDRCDYAPVLIHDGDEVIIRGIWEGSRLGNGR